MTTTPPRLNSLPAYVEHYSVVTPDHEAVVDGTVVLTYAKLQEQVLLLHQRLKHAGLHPGQRVAFMGSPGIEFWVSLLATQRLGAVWLGVNPLYTERELVYVLGDARPVLIWADSRLSESSQKALAGAAHAVGMKKPVLLSEGVAALAASLQGESLHDAGSDEDAPQLVAQNVCLIVYTSGTTGAPKGAMLSSEGLVANGWWLSKRMGFKSTRGLVNLPINHVGCIGDLCATGMVSGGTLVFMHRFDPVRSVELLRSQHLNWIAQVPAQFQLMVTEGGLKAEHLRSIQHLVWGGAAMSETLIRQFAASVPDLFNSYGLTECSGTITVTEPNADVDVLAHSIGKPVNADFVRLADEHGKPVPGVGSGEIQIKGPHVFKGYLRRPDATRAAFTSDGWLRTGDMGSIDADGNIRLIGRTHEMYKSGGYNVYPREIELVLEGLQGVELAAVFGVPDPLWDEVGVAFVQGDPQVITEELLRQHCLASLARYKVPKHFEVCTALPLLPIGKVDKKKLQSLAAQRHAQ